MEERSHWADEAAREVLSTRPGPQVLSTGISPSGPIHVGNLREILTADAVLRALRDAGAEAELHFVADSFDPLRRVYPFLKEEAYGPLVGCPLSDIPCPCGDHASYAEHFLEPFLDSLRRLRVDLEVLRSDRLYREGRMNGAVLAALEQRDRIAGILKELTGKEVDESWSPFTPLCPECGRIDRGRVHGFSREAETVSVGCGCGFRGDLPLTGAGKLTWRVDWPARWSVLGVTLEPFGKDHASRGGSYDTGARIAREVYGIEAPFPVPYEWISLKGMGDMASSKGNVLSVEEALEIVPPEALRYIVLRQRPGRAISLDPGLPLLNFVDEVDNPEARGRNDRAAELSRAGGFRPTGVPFKHLVVVAQIARFDRDRLLEILARGGYPEVDRDSVSDRLDYARSWLERFAPEEMRFEVPDSTPEAAAALGEVERAFLGDLARSLGPELDGAAIHALVYELAEARGLSAKEAFRAIYLAILGRPRGPRAGDFLAFLGPEFSAERLSRVARG
jgi:lysyl-tRNA synthetase class 1